MKRFVIGSLTVLVAILAMLAVLAMLAPAHAAPPVAYEAAGIDSCLGQPGPECIFMAVTHVHVQGQEPGTVLTYGVQNSTVGIMDPRRIIIPYTEVTIPPHQFVFDPDGGTATLLTTAISLTWELNGSKNGDVHYDKIDTASGVATWLVLRGVTLSARVRGVIGPVIVDSLNASLSTTFLSDTGSLTLLSVNGRRATVQLTGGFGNIYDWLTVVPVGAPENTYLPQWIYVGFEVRDRTWTTAPLAPGRYEFRYYRDDLFDFVARSAPFTIP